jgi:preprotein translocase subunit SecG
MNITSNKEKGKIMSIADSFSSFSLVNVSVNGGWKEEENEGEEEELSCSWSHSLLHFSASLLSSLELFTIMNSREGGISISEGGRVEIIDGMFENNTAESSKYPSFRHNILCLNGELNIESLKGGVGLLPNSSLFLSSSSSCSLKKKEEEIFIPLFIPHISSIDEPDKTNGMKITFNGDSLFPCSLSFSLFINSSSSSRISFPSSLSCENENKCIGEINENEIESKIGEYSLLYGTLDYSDNKGNHLSTESVLIANLMKNPSEGEDGNLSEGGNNNSSSSSSSQTTAVVFIVFFIVSLFVIVGLIIFFIITRRRRKKKKGEKIKKQGREMNSTENEKAIVYKEDSEKEEEEGDDDDNENKKEEEEKEKPHISKSPSTEHLLSPSVVSEGKRSLVENDEKKKEKEKENEKEETEKKKTEEEKIEIPYSTSISMSFLVEGYGTSCPFNKVLVDLRDSLGYQLRTGIRKFNHKERNELGIEVVYFVGRGVENMIERRIGIDSLFHLSTENIIFSSEGGLCITPLDISSIEENQHGIKGNEWKRFSCPEILKGQVREGNSETIVFTLGIILYSCLSASIPFNEVDSETAGNMIIEGKRPSIEGMVEEWKEWIDLIVSCWNEEGRRRIRLNELIEEMLQRGGNLFKREERMRKRLERKEKLKKVKEEKEKKEEESKVEPRVLF